MTDQQCPRLLVRGRLRAAHCNDEGHGDHDKTCSSGVIHLLRLMHPLCGCESTKMKSATSSVRPGNPHPLPLATALGSLRVTLPSSNSSVFASSSFSFLVGIQYLSLLSCSCPEATEKPGHRTPFQYKHGGNGCRTTGSGSLAWSSNSPRYSCQCISLFLSLFPLKAPAFTHPVTLCNLLADFYLHPHQNSSGQNDQWPHCCSLKKCSLF